MAKYRSKFEKVISESLKKRKVKFTYEDEKLKYTEPATEKSYTIDFKLPNGIIIETKGRLTLYDRKKMLLVKEQHPDLDIRFVFQRANNKIRKGSKTTYADWADKNGFLWADGEIPDSWLNE